jgi:hypothetical protein
MSRVVGLVDLIWVFYILYRKEPSLPLFDLSISGLPNALSNLTEAEAANSTVKVTVHLTESDIIVVPQAILALPELAEESTMADKLKGLFGHKSEKDDAATADNGDGSETATPKAAKKSVESVPLRVEIRQNGFLPLSADEMADAKKR